MNTSRRVHGICLKSTPTNVCVRQLNTTISWFVWKGDIFRVPLSTLYRSKGEGGWDLTDLPAKSHVLFLYRKQQVMKQCKITSAWMRTWGLNVKGANPLLRDIIPENLEYLRRFAMYSAYVDEQGFMESKRTYKRRAYNTLCHISRSETGIQDMRISKIWPSTDWNTVWKNIPCNPVPGGTKASWYKVTHDIIPTIVRLHKLRISPTDKCNNCGMHDTLQHRLIECGKGPQICQWTTQKLILFLRTIPTIIPSEWLFTSTMCTVASYATACLHVDTG